MSVLQTEFEPQELPELTREVFWEKWGDTCGFDEFTFKLIWDKSKHYYTNLPYHNFNHACETLWETMRLVDECRDHDVEVNSRALVVATLFHDANYYRQLPKRYDTKENYSAAILTQENHQWLFEMTGDELFTAQNAIIATTHGSEIYSIEDKILRRADLNNIAGRYVEDFITKTLLLHRETEQLTGKKINIWDFAATSIKILSEYLDDDLSLGDWDDHKARQSVFQFKAIDNIKRLATEVAEYRGQKIITFIQNLGWSAIKMVLPKND